MEQFNSENFHYLCDKLAILDSDFKSIITEFGYPPLWSRTNSFESLVHIILEQQVSLASALAALNKLKEKLIQITPAGFLRLTDEELRLCYFSRQKTSYVRSLALAIEHGDIDLNILASASNEEIRRVLSQLKGIGNWTVDVYLIFVLKRVDIFPLGDLAAVNAIKELKKLPKEVTKESLAGHAGLWQPYRTVATMLLWHYYLSRRVKKKRIKSEK